MSRGLIYAFDQFHLDAHTRRLMVAESGVPVHLTPRAFDTLLMLVERAGTLVEKPVLMQALWPGMVVEPNGLDQHISSIRHALGERPGEHRFIVTEPRRGYRFVAAVTRMSSTSGADDDPGQLYQQALALHGRPTFENLNGCIVLLQRAIERNPRFARAMAELAMTYVDCVAYSAPIDRALESAEQMALRAISLDDTEADAHAALGMVHAVRGHWLPSAAAYDRALSLRPDWRTQSLMAVYLCHPVGHIRRSLAAAEAILQANPPHPLPAVVAALSSCFLGQDAQALTYLDQATALGLPRSSTPVLELRAQHAWRARSTDCLEQYLAMMSPAMRSAGGEDAVALLGRALGGENVSRAASRCLQQMEDGLPAAELSEPVRKRLVLWYVMSGALEAAHDFTWRCLDHFATRGTVGTAWGFLWMPEMAEFRRHRRFDALVGRLGLRHYWDKYGGPDTTSSPGLSGSTVSMLSVDSP